MRSTVGILALQGGEDVNDLFVYIEKDCQTLHMAGNPQISHYQLAKRARQA
jgi:hypothetical protein